MKRKRIMDAIGILSEAPIYIDDSPQLRVIEMRSKAKRLNFERNINLIIVDHLGLIPVTRESKTGSRKSATLPVRSKCWPAN